MTKSKGIIKPMNFSVCYLLSSDIHVHPAGIAMFESIDGLNMGTDRHLGDSHVLLMCRVGFVRIKINDRCYKLHSQTALIIIPGSIYQIVEMSPDMQWQCISLSKLFVNEIVGEKGRLQKMVEQFRQNALISLDLHKKKALQSLYDQIKIIFEQEKSHPFLQEVLKSLATAMFWTASGYINRSKPKISVCFSKTEEFFRNFIQLVVAFHQLQHGTLFYAERLGVTVKYLSFTIKILSSKSAKEWIDSYLITSAEKLLTDTDKSIQQIAIELNFPDQAFFSKFFKRQTNSSPKDFRNNFHGENISVNSDFPVENNNGILIPD